MRKRFETYLQYCLSFQTCHVLLISRVLSFLFSMQLVIELGNSEVKRLRESIQQLKFMLRSEVATNDHDGHHDEWEDETSFETMGNEVIEKSGNMGSEVSKLEAALVRYDKMIRELNDNAVILDLVTAAGVAIELHVKLGEIGSKVLTQGEIYSLCKNEDDGMEVSSSSFSW